MYRNALSVETMQERRRQVLRMCGISKSVDALFGEHAKLITHPIGDATFVCHDTTLQMCIPSLEYPVSDWPANIKFGGNAAGETSTFGADASRLVRRAEGEFEALNHALEPSQSGDGGPKEPWVSISELLVVPTLNALAERDDLLVVAVLCVRGATLDASLSRFPG